MHLNVYIKQSDGQVHLDPLQIFQKFKPQTVNGNHCRGCNDEQGLSKTPALLTLPSHRRIDHSPFSCAGPFGILTSGSVSLFISGPLWFPFLPAAASTLAFGPVSPFSLQSTERHARPLRPATRLTHS